MVYFLNPFFSLSWDNNKWHDNHAEDFTLNRKNKNLTMLHEYKIIMYPFPLKHGSCFTLRRLILIILINYHFTCVSRSLLYFCCNVMTPNDAYFSVMILNHDCFRSNNCLQVQNIITESYFLF